MVWTAILAGLLQLQVLFETELWPGEGRPAFEAVGRHLTLRAEPFSFAVVTSDMEVPPGQRLTFDETRYRTVASGLFQVRRTTAVAGRDLGDLTMLSRAAYYTGRFARIELPVSAGDTVEYLQDRAEGTCFVRVRSHTIDADPCPRVLPDDFETSREPTVEWWIHVIGVASGWVIVSGDTVRVVDRRG